MPHLRVDNKTISTPVIDIIKAIKSQLFNGKLKVIKSRGNNIRVTCPFHKDGLENKASADIYVGDETDKLQYGYFKCFTCGAQHPFYRFVAECFEISERDAKKWLIDNFADGIVEYEVDLPEISLEKPKSRRQIIPEEILDTFENFHPYMIQRKLSKRIIDVFELKYDPKTRCIVFPVRDERGALVMLTRRSVEDKTFYIDKEKEKPLYLLNYILDNDIQECMITEGQIDALTACTYGFPCVATMGAISDHQIELINKSGIRILYVMFDNDDAGQRFTKKLLSNIRKDILVVNVPIKIAGKKDINDLSQDEFDYCIAQAEASL